MPGSNLTVGIEFDENVTTRRRRSGQPYSLDWVRVHKQTKVMNFRPFLRLLAGRFLQSVATLWLVTVLFFLMIELMPGDFAIASATKSTTEQMMEATRFRLGLYASAPVRYVQWLFGLLSGDLGTSWWMKSPIASLLAERLWHSAWLVAWATALAVPFAIGAALTAVARRGGFFDRCSATMAVAAMSVPDFFVAYILMYLLAVYFDVFPAFTFFALDIPFLERLHATGLPILSLAAVTVTPMFRLTRAALLNVMDEDYIQMAELKGVGPWRILFRHALPNVIGPIANAIVLVIANLFFGLVIIETIFSYPGLGFLLVKATLLHDVPLVQACALITAAVYITLNFLADAVGIIANPRLRDRIAYS